MPHNTIGTAAISSCDSLHRVINDMEAMFKKPISFRFLWCPYRSERPTARERKISNCVCALVPHCSNRTTPKVTFFGHFLQPVPQKGIIANNHSVPKATACFRARRLGDRSTGSWTNRTFPAGRCSVSTSTLGTSLGSLLIAESEIQ